MGVKEKCKACCKNASFTLSVHTLKAVIKQCCNILKNALSKWPSFGSFCKGRMNGGIMKIKCFFCDKVKWAAESGSRLD